MIRTRDICVTSEKQNVRVNNVPSAHTVVMKNQLQQMKKNSETLNKIVVNLERGKYKGTEEVNRLLGDAALIMLQTLQDILRVQLLSLLLLRVLTQAYL